ncbi:MAG: hypothetical protein P4M00_18675 [Azospirillaceae bacterium]|nr:hypothetical protein [Azospirillaceae bacterium]
MTEVVETYVLTFTEGHACKIDVEVRILSEQTEIQETLAFNGIDRLDHAELCTALYLLGFAMGIEQAVHGNNLNLRKVVLNQEPGKRIGFVEVELHGPTVRRIVHIVVTDCLCVKDASAAARRRLIEIGKAVAEQAARRIHDHKPDLAIVKAVQPPNVLIAAGLAAANNANR